MTFKLHQTVASEYLTQMFHVSVNEAYQLQHNHQKLFLPKPKRSSFPYTIRLESSGSTRLSLSTSISRARQNIRTTEYSQNSGYEKESPIVLCFPSLLVQDDTFNLMVGTHNRTLMIYQNVTLVWAAQLPHIPVDAKVANFM